MKNLFKNIIERVLALAIFILLIPFFIFLSIIIYLDLKEFPIFIQKRVGKNGDLFYIYKFKTLKDKTPNNIPTECIDNYEIYSTKLGIFLRKSSIDETLQLLNIIKGNMSFVGPRPVMVNEEELNLKRLNLGIYNVNPGITGLAQINGRDNLTVDEKIKYDIEYINKKSIIFDIYILYLTIFKVLKKENIK